MGAQRTVACPHCSTGRVTKATGRQRLACVACGRSFLVRDAAPVAVPDPAAGGSEAVPQAPPAADQAPAPEPAVAARTGGIAGVEVLPPATLRLGAPRFADPDPPAAVPAAEAPPVPEEPAAPTVSDMPPVVTRPGRRVGYYGRVTGGGRG